MENKILNGLFIATAGIIGAKFVRATMEAKRQQKEHGEIMDDAEQEESRM